MAYFNSLGSEGWEIVSYTPRIYGTTVAMDWGFGAEGHPYMRTYPPCGFYLLKRQVE